MRLLAALMLFASPAVALDVPSGQPLELQEVLVDRQHLGNLLGIGSFIAYGLLCTVVGYFAPAPPRASTSEGDATGEPA